MSLIAAFLLFAVVVALPTSAQTTSVSAACKELTPAKVAVLARDIAERKGILISQYRISSISYRFMKGEWRVFFFLERSPDDRLPTGLPMCASVYVDDKANVTNVSTCQFVD